MERMITLTEGKVSKGGQNKLDEAFYSKPRPNPPGGSGVKKPESNAPEKTGFYWVKQKNSDNWIPAELTSYTTRNGKYFEVFIIGQSDAYMVSEFTWGPEIQKLEN